MKRMRRKIRLAPLICMLALVPYLVGFTPFQGDSSWTEVGFALGRGSYAEITRDCNGRILRVDDIPFSEVGVSLDHYTPVLHLGLKGGAFREDRTGETMGNEKSFNYVNPVIGLNTRYFGLDLGYGYVSQLAAERRGGFLTGSLRLGSLDGAYFQGGLCDDLPLTTGGPGVLNIGMGFNLGKPRQILWTGIGLDRYHMGGPYYATMFGAKLELPVSDAVLLTFGGSYGNKERAEYGLSAGTRIRF